MKIKIEDLAVGEGTQTRVRLDAATVTEYAEAYLAGERLPPVVAFTSNGSPKIVADGFHRIAGALEAGMTQVEVELRRGGKPEAIRFALGANAKHGLRRTPEDKALAVRIAFENFPDLSNQAAAKLVGVCDDFVRKHRPAEPDPEDVARDNPPTVGGSPQKSGPPARGDRTRVGVDGVRRRIPPSGPPRPAQKAAQRDRTGLAIPDEIQELWNDAEEIQGQLAALSTIRGILKRAEDGRALIFAEVNFSSAYSKIDQLYLDLKTVRPHAVCPACQGLARRDCGACKGRGFVSQFWWDNCATKEQRSARDKAKGA